MFFPLSLSLFLDCIDIICAFSTLALVFKARKKKKERTEVGGEAAGLNRVSRFGEQKRRYFKMSLLAPFWAFFFFLDRSVRARES